MESGQGWSLDPVLGPSQISEQNDDHFKGRRGPAHSPGLLRVLSLRVLSPPSHSSLMVASLSDGHSEEFGSPPGAGGMGKADYAGVLCH